MKPGCSYWGQAVFHQGPFRLTANIRSPLSTVHRTVYTNPQSYQLLPPVSSAAFSSLSPLSPKPHHWPLLNCIFFHCSDNCGGKSYISNYNNRLPQCWSPASLGDRNKICLPGSSQGCEQTQDSWRTLGPAGQATLRKALFAHIESKHLSLFMGALPQLAKGSGTADLHQSWVDKLVPSLALLSKEFGFRLAARPPLLHPYPSPSCSSSSSSLSKLLSDKDWRLGVHGWPWLQVSSLTWTPAFLIGTKS